MCGRYALRIALPELARVLGMEPPAGFESEARYNIAPTQTVPMVQAAPGGRPRFERARWGLVPAWSKGPDARYSMFNARVEGIASKPAFRAPVRRQRCVVPADGWYEWKRTGAGKQPYLIHAPNHAPFLFAGVWDRWQDAHGAELVSCAILTTDASGPPGEIHSRMPVLVSLDDWAAWLDPKQTDAAAALAQLDASRAAQTLRATAVSRYVNDARHEGPECVEPAAAP